MHMLLLRRPSTPNGTEGNAHGATVAQFITKALDDAQKQAKLVPQPTNVMEVDNTDKKRPAAQAGHDEAIEVDAEKTESEIKALLLEHGYPEQEAAKQATSVASIAKEFASGTTISIKRRKL